MRWVITVAPSSTSTNVGMSQRGPRTSVEGNVAYNPPTPAGLARLANEVLDQRISECAATFRERNLLYLLRLSPLLPWVASKEELAGI